MALNPPHPQATITPTAADTELARKSSRQLTKLLDNPAVGNQLNIKLHGQAENEPEEIVTIPIAAFRLLTDILDQMAQGNAITLIPVNAELTTQQAAEILNVSRPFLITLTDQGKIPSRKVGTHRRIRFADLMAYKQNIDHQRNQALEELTRQAQELNMGY